MVDTVQGIIYTILSKVIVGYENPKLFHLTPSQKKIAKAICRGSKTSIAQAVLVDNTIHQNVLKKHKKTNEGGDQGYVF